MAKENTRRRKHFISVLGTGNYTPCTYFLEEQTCDTKFVQEAVLKLACGELCVDDRVTICLTEGARRQNWEDRSYTQWEIDNHKDAEGETYEGLHTVLKRCLGEIPNIGIKEKDIATGQNSREIARMFSEIYEVIDEEEEIYFDVTHGLRNIPMLVMAVLEYAKVTKNISIGGTYYGAFEVGETDQETKKRRVPIYDLTFYHMIMNWSNAANSFIKYGHGDEINDLADEKWRVIAQTAQKSQEKEELSGNLNYVAKKLQKFTSSIETGRGKIEYSQSVKKCYKDYVEQQKKISERLIGEFFPFRELLNKIEHKMEGFQNALTNLEVGMAVIDWCIDNHMVQQGYTALEETVKTFLCEKIGVPQDEEFWREKVVKRLCVGLYKEREAPDKILDNWMTFLQETEKDDLLIQEGYKKGKELWEMIIGNEQHRKLLKLMDQISSKRNDINHFGFTRDSAKAEDLKKDLKKRAGEFRKIQEEWDL